MKRQIKWSRGMESSLGYLEKEYFSKCGQFRITQMSFDFPSPSKGYVLHQQVGGEWVEVQYATRTHHIFDYLSDAKDHAEFVVNPNFWDER